MKTKTARICLHAHHKVLEGNEVLGGTYQPMKTKTARICLTEEDWTEIYYALKSKKTAICRGDYQEEKKGQNAKWTQHIEAILHKIGHDGITAFNHFKKPRTSLATKISR